MTDKSPEKVGEMFDRISGTYDLLNKLLSLGIDRNWRRKAIRLVSSLPHNRILDIASGTGDLSLAAARVGSSEIIAADISAGMLAIQNERIKKLNLGDKIKTVIANAEHLPFESASFDLVTCAFGIRNFENLEKGLSEIQRVLKPGGSFIILEFSKPAGWFGKIFQGYFNSIVPRLGHLVSGHSQAYRYLFNTVQDFPSGSDFVKILQETGFTEAKYIPLTRGIATLYSGKKKAVFYDSLN